MAEGKQCVRIGPCALSCRDLVSQRTLIRIFRAFASLGFDDNRWFSTEDLRALLAIADRDEAKMRADLLAVQARLTMGQSQGFHHESEKKKFEKDAAKLQAELDHLAEDTSLYKEELSRRSPHNS